MTLLGGHAVGLIVVKAGFTGDTEWQALVVAYAASGWRDDYAIVIPGSPSLDRFGLFGLSAAQAAPVTPTELRDPFVSAQVARRLWESSGEGWEWADVVRSNGGVLIRQAFHTINGRNLWDSKTPRRDGLPAVIGRPNGHDPFHAIRSKHG
jgi:hypothetical protein